MNLNQTTFTGFVLVVSALALSACKPVPLTAPGGARGLSAGEITISYDENVLRLFDVQPGAFLSIDGKAVTFTPTFNPGSVTITFAREQDTTGLRGSGHLVRLGFEVLAESPPRVVSVRGSLRDSNGAAIPASFASLRIEVR